uniref:Uncharacterized protein n=1 Tax=Strigamia maritima TaxID=126957 RepID=T1JCU3_STRMM
MSVQSSVKSTLGIEEDHSKRNKKILIIVIVILLLLLLIIALIIGYIIGTKTKGCPKEKVRKLSDITADKEVLTGKDGSKGKMAVDKTRVITFSHAKHYGTENDETNGDAHLRVREVLIRQHRVPDDTSLHSGKHIRVSVARRRVTTEIERHSTDDNVELNTELIMMLRAYDVAYCGPDNRT